MIKKIIDVVVSTLIVSVAIFGTIWLCGTTVELVCGAEYIEPSWEDQLVFDKMNKHKTELVSTRYFTGEDNLIAFEEVWYDGDMYIVWHISSDHGSIDIRSYEDEDEWEVLSATGDFRYRSNARYTAQYYGAISGGRQGELCKTDVYYNSISKGMIKE